MGDYDTLASDFTKAHRGFVGAYDDIPVMLLDEATVEP